MCQLWLLSSSAAALGGWGGDPQGRTAKITHFLQRLLTAAVYARSGVEGGGKSPLCPGGQVGAGAGRGGSLGEPAKACPLSQSRSTGRLSSGHQARNSPGWDRDTGEVAPGQPEPCLVTRHLGHYENRSGMGDHLTRIAQHFPSFSTESSPSWERPGPGKLRQFVTLIGARPP